MTHGIQTVLYPVTDLARAKAVYGGLFGIEPHADAPYYVGFKVGDQEIGLVPNGHEQGMTGPVAYVHVDDIKKTLQLLVDAGARSHEEVRNVGGGRLIASVKDADDNVIGLIQDP